MAEGKSLAANSLSFQDIDIAMFLIWWGSNPALGAERNPKKQYDTP